MLPQGAGLKGPLWDQLWALSGASTKKLENIHPLFTVCLFYQYRNQFWVVFQCPEGHERGTPLFGVFSSTRWAGQYSARGVPEYLWIFFREELLFPFSFSQRLRESIHRKGRSAFLALEVRFLPVKDPKGAPTTKGPGGVHRCPRSNLSLNLVPRSSSFLNFTFEDTREKFLRLHSAISSADLRSYDARYSNKVELSQNNLYYLISDILSLF